MADTKPISYRKLDHIIDEEVMAYLDSHLYNQEGIVFERVDDIETQRNGCDVVFSCEAVGIKDAIIDEKTATHYCNRDLNTFAFELSQVTKKGYIVDGWFLSNSCTTEYYMLVYLKADIPNMEDDKPDWRKITRDNITQAEYLLIKKYDILDYLNSIGFDKQRLQRGCNYLRSHNDRKRFDLSDDAKLVISRQFKECPVNAVIAKDRLMELSKMHGFV